MDIRPDATLKEKLNAEKVKLRGLTFKKKLEYIWDYYKYPILGICAGLVIAGSLIHTRYIDPPPKTALFISWNAGFITEEQRADLSALLAERITDETANEDVVISPALSSDGDPTFGLASFQRTVAMLAAGEIDIFILDKQLLVEYSKSRFLLPIDGILAEIKSKDPVIYGRIEENITYAPAESENGVYEEQIMGISIGSNPLMARLGFWEQELYIGIAITTNNIEKITESIIVIFE